MKYFIVYWWEDTKMGSKKILNSISDIPPIDWLKNILSIKSMYERYALIYWFEISEHNAEKIKDLIS